MGLPEDAGGLLDLANVNRRRGHSGCLDDAIGRLLPNVDRYLHRHGTGHTGGELVDGLLPDADRVDAAADVTGVLGDLAQNRSRVGQVVQDSGAPAPELCGDGSDESQHPGVAPVGACEAGRSVEHARAGHHAQRRRPGGDLGRAQGHVGRALLVAGRYRADVAGIGEGVEEVVVLNAGQAEQHVHAQRPEGLDREPGDRGRSGRPAAGHNCRSRRGSGRVGGPVSRLRRG